jgi:hypothetical protein
VELFRQFELLRNQHGQLNLTPERIQLIQSLLSTFELLDFSLQRLSTSDRFDLQKLVMSPGWIVLEKYYEIITSEFYKRIVASGDIQSARNIISLLTAFKNRPKNKGKFYAQDNNHHSQNSHNKFSKEFSKTLKEDGEEFL